MCRGSMPYQGTVEQRKLFVLGGSSHLVSVVTKHGDTASKWPKLMAKNNGGDPNYLHPLQAHPPSAGKKFIIHNGSEEQDPSISKKY